MTTIELSATPLTPTPAPYEEWRLHWPDCLRAYDKASKAERHADEQVKADPSNRKAKDNVMFARVVGYLLVELFNRRAILSEGPCASMVKQLEPESGDSNDLVFRIGEWHRNHLLRLFRISTQKYPTPSLHPSRLSLDTLADMARDCMEANGKDYRTARRKALVRDGFRCILTGVFDYTSTRQNPELDQLRRSINARAATVQACHILNESTMQDVDPTGTSEESTVSNKTEYAVSAMAILEHFGLGSHAEKLLEVDGVHGLGNLLSLDTSVHADFDRLNLWFEGTDEPNCYTVCVSDKGNERYLRQFGHLHADGGRLFVTFSSPHQDLRLPDPRLLGLHAACARVAHMSGAAEAFDEFERDVEDTRVLAFDGSSARLLDHCLTPFAVVPGIA